MDNKFLIFGSDEKMLSCKKRLDQLGFSAECISHDAIEEQITSYKNLILPVPTVTDGCVSGISFELFCSMLKSENIVLCGNISPKEFPCKAYSYYFNDDFLLKNSRLTAQGTLRIILDNIKTDIQHMRAAVLGYGNCGKEICAILKRNGADVTSFSRRDESVEAARKSGMKSERIKLVEENLSSFDVIVNTVPCNIISTDTLKSLTENNLYVEIASKPYGFDAADMDKYDFRYVPAGSLPGKFTPVSAGINIADTVADIIKESESYE